jgi:hypothetical protein
MGIDRETFRLAAQCLNHYATQGPLMWYISFTKIKTRIHRSFKRDFVCGMEMALVKKTSVRDSVLQTA